MLDRIEFDNKTKAEMDAQVERLYKNLGEYIKLNSKIRELPIDNPLDDVTKKRIESWTIPEKGRDPEVIEKEIVNDVLQHSLMIQHPRMFSFVSSAVSPYSLAGNILTDIYNVNAGGASMNLGGQIIEDKLVKWMGSLAGFEAEKCGGVFLSGGSISNMSALIAARLNKLTEDEYSIGVAYLNDQCHSSVRKALKLIGLRKDQIRIIDTDENYKTDVVALENAIKKDITAGKKPFLVIANLGSTNTGAICPFDKIGDIAARYDMWFHVDGAYGGSVLVSPIFRNLAKGIEKADSLTWDTHKWLMQTYSCSTLIVKDKDTLLNAFVEHPEYLADVINTDYNDPWDLGPEMSHPNRSLKLWYTIQALGTDLLADIIDYSFYNARIVESFLNEHQNWEIISAPSCGTINFRYAPNDLNNSQIDELTSEISRRIIGDGYAYVVTTTLRGKKTLRMCMINANSSEEDVKSTMIKLEEIAKAAYKDLFAK